MGTTLIPTGGVNNDGLLAPEDGDPMPPATGEIVMLLDEPELDDPVALPPLALPPPPPPPIVCNLECVLRLLVELKRLLQTSH